MIRHTLEAARFSAAASPCGTGVVTDFDGRVERDGTLAIDIASMMVTALRTLALHPEKAPVALAAITGNQQCEGLIHAAVADPSSAWGIASCLEHAIADCKEIAASSSATIAPKVTEAAVQIVAEQMLRRYESEYNADHLTWRDFADDARADLDAALPALNALDLA